jgi:Pyruvate/2-oxoacid:ferredoxin oxidoreductase gamma subunit
MKEVSILVGGKAGDGIRQAGHVITRLLDRFAWVAIPAGDSPQQGVS